MKVHELMFHLIFLEMTVQGDIILNSQRKL